MSAAVLQTSVHPAAQPAPLPEGSALPLRIRVTEGPDQDKEFAMYDVQLMLPSGQGWVVSRRYSEFLNLKEELDAHLSDSDRELFPPKHIFSGSKSEKVVAERLDMLPRWLMAISRHAGVTLHPTFRSFLELDANAHLLADADAAAHASSSIASVSSSSDPAAALKLQAGFNQPGAVREVERATVRAMPTAADPAVREITAQATAPPRAGDEHATAEVKVDVTLPTVDVSDARQRAAKVSELVSESQARAEEAHTLDVKAREADAKAERLAMEAQQVAGEAEVVKAETEALRIQADAQNAEAERLEREAAALRDAAARDAKSAAAREKDAKHLEAEAAARFKEYNDAANLARETAERARKAYAEAREKSLNAQREHAAAVAALEEAERVAKDAALEESRRQAAEAAAAAARTKHSIAEAAMLKAQEEAAIAAAHSAAQNEAEAMAQMALAKQRLDRARAMKSEMEGEARVAQEGAAAKTQEAAIAAAEVDAHTNAAALLERETSKIEQEVEQTGAAIVAPADVISSDLFSTGVVDDVVVTTATTVPLGAPEAPITEERSDTHTNSVLALAAIDRELRFAVNAVEVRLHSPAPALTREDVIATPTATQSPLNDGSLYSVNMSPCVGDACIVRKESPGLDVDASLLPARTPPLLSLSLAADAASRLDITSLEAEHMNDASTSAEQLRALSPDAAPVHTKSIPRGRSLSVDTFASAATDDAAQRTDAAKYVVDALTPVLQVHRVDATAKPSASAPRTCKLSAAMLVGATAVGLVAAYLAALVGGKN